MNATTLWVIYFPIFYMLLFVYPSMTKKRAILKQNKRRKRERIMANELLKEMIGKTCYIATGSFGTSFSRVQIVEIVDNWVKVDNLKGQIDLVNADYITHVRILPEKTK